MKHIVLVGFMGCGKTRVGRALARELGLPFVDMDEQIVARAKMPVTDIFAKHGEAYFREMETAVLEDLLAEKKQMVIGSGGGVPMQEANRPLLEESMVVYIEAPIGILMERLANDKKRPILKGGDLREKITTMLEVRNPIYEQVSDIEVSTNNGSVERIVQQIVEKLVEKRV